MARSVAEVPQQKDSQSRHPFFNTNIQNIQSFQLSYKFLKQDLLESINNYSSISLHFNILILNKHESHIKWRSSRRPCAH